MTRHSDAARAVQETSFRIADREPDAWSFGVWKNLVIGVWSKRATAIAVQTLAKTSRSFNTKYTSVHIIKSGAALPTPEGRAALGDLLKERSGKLACITVVLLGSGFWASAVQSMITGLHMLTGRAMKLRICETLDEAAAWLGKEHPELTGVPVTTAELRAVFEEALAAAGS